MGNEKLCTFAKHYKDYPLLWDRVSKNKGVSALTEMPFFSIEIEPQGYFHTSRKPFTRLKIFIMKQKGVFRIGLSLYFGFEAPKLVRVKAYERIRNGKVEKVRSHYRNVEGRLVIRNELHR